MEISEKDYIRNNASNDSVFDDLFEEHVSLLQHSKIARMNQVVVSTDDKYVIGTTALDTCTGILFYDPVNKKGIVGHASPGNEIGIMIEMLKLIDVSKKTIIEYGFVEGYRALEEHNDNAINIFKKYIRVFPELFPNVRFISKTIYSQLCEGYLAYEFAFNTKSGTSANLVFDNNILGRHK